MTNQTPRAPTPADTIKALRDALTWIADSQQNEQARVARAALTADASEDAPDLWARIDAYADARDEYQHSTARHLAKTQLENAEHAKAELASALASLAAPDAPADPMDWPLPCDVIVGAGTIRKGCALRTLVARMKVMNDMIREGWSSAPAAPVADAGGAVAGPLWCEACGADRSKEFCNKEHWQACKFIGTAYAAEQAKPEAGEQAGEVKPRTMSMCATKDYMHGWNDCLKAVGTGKPSELEKKIDTAIEIARELLHQRHDRRGPVRPHEPERRDGFDRRARVAPIKE